MAYMKAYIIRFFVNLGLAGILFVSVTAFQGDPLCKIFIYLSLACAFGEPLRVYLEKIKE